MYLVIVCRLRHRMLTYDVVCYMYDIVCLFWRHLQSTLNFQKQTPQGVCIWPASLLHLAPLFRPCKQCRHVRNTVIFYIKNGYGHAPIWWPQNQWTVQTPSLGVREPRCTIPGNVGCFYPDVQGARVGGFGQCGNGANTMNYAVSIACVGISMRVRLIEWAPVVLERQAGYKTGHEPMWIECFRGPLARVQAARAAAQNVLYSPKKEIWSGSLNMIE